MISSLFYLFGLKLVLFAISVTAAPKPNIRDIRFFCIHPSDTTYKEIRMSDVTDISNKVDLKLGFAFLVHGWQSKFRFDDKVVKLGNICNAIGLNLSQCDITENENLESVSYKIGLEWVKANKTNFCGVDWRELASVGYYEASQMHVKNIGTRLASFLTALHDVGVKMDSIKIAGHSLGAHISGLAGKIIFESLGNKISTIFGLDPAGPFFTSFLLRSDVCLSKSDATFVQVLHTSSGTYGTSEMLGHADFKANGGKIQTACVDDVLGAKDLLFTCSHSFANEIFLYSFSNSCSGVAEKKSGGILDSIKNLFSKDKSDGTDVYGIHNKGMHGVFELETSNAAPYCKKK